MGFRPTIDMGLSPVFRTPTVMAIRVSGDSARRRYEETLGNLDRAVPQRLIAGITLPTTRTALREFDCSMKVNVSEGQSADRLNVHSAQLVGWQDVLRSEVNMVNIVNLSSPLSVVVCLVSLGGGSCSPRQWLGTLNRSGSFDVWSEISTSAGKFTTDPNPRGSKLPTLKL